MEDIRSSGLGWRTSEALDCYGHHQKLWIVMDARSLLVVSSSSFYVEQTTSLLVNNLVFSPEEEQQQQHCCSWVDSTPCLGAAVAGGEDDSPAPS
ncbi:unnamed protein product [Sphagnum balticum]